MKRRQPAVYLQVLGLLCAVALLLWLFSRAQAVNPAVHNQVVGDLRELQARDIELGENALRLHFHLEANYDRMVAITQRMRALTETLQAHQQAGRLPDTPDILAALQGLRQRLADKEDAAEQFKSNNAVLKNSLGYLPRVVAVLQAEMPRSDAAVYNSFGHLLREALLLSVNPGSQALDRLREAAARIGAELPALPPDVQRTARRAQRHAEILVELEPQTEKLLAALSSPDANLMGSDLERAYLNHYQQHQHAATRYRLLLLAGAILALSTAAWLFARNRQKGQQLAAALAQIGNQQQALDEHAIVSVTDVRGNIVAVNDRFLRISGYEERELLGQNHRMISSGLHDKAFFVELWRTIAHGQVWHGQVANRRKNGEIYWVEATVVPFMDEAGKPYQYVSVRTDITAQKALEAEIDAQRRLLQNVMDTLGEGVYTLDLEGRCTYLNPEAERLLGWSADELRGRVLCELLCPDTADPSAREGQAVLRSTARGETFRSDSGRFRRKDGSSFPVSMVAAPLSDGRQQVGVVAAFQDISERKRAEASLLRAKEAAESSNKAKSEFLAVMSHEIRTPMNGIIGMTELALDTPLSARQREFLDEVKASADALLVIINDILDFSKVEAGKLQLECVPFGLRALLASCQCALALRAAQKGLALVCEVAPEVPDTVMGDPVRLRQVLTNLLGNAIKFSEHGEVALRVRCLDAPAEPAEPNRVRLQVCVEDQGIGIAPEHQAHIFGAFTQADASTTRRYGGTGLGLSISRRLVQAMGGQLGVHSVLGQGSRFSFDLSLRVADDAAGPASGLWPDVSTNAPAAQLDRPLRILLAEDNPVNQKLALSLLRKWGHTVTVVSDGAQALARSGAESFDVILMDLQMPVMGGIEATRLIRQRESGRGGRLKIVAMTANALSEDRQRCLEAGMDEHVAKPLRPEHLRAVLRALPELAGASAPGGAGSTGGAAPDATTARPYLPAFDPEALLAQAEPWVIEAIGEAFVADAPRLMAEVAAAVQARDAPALLRGAHTLRGLFGEFGAEPLRALATRLESLASQGDWAGAEAVAGQLDAGTQALAGALRQQAQPTTG
jgi:PAS domain S-box-containing protein